VIGTDAREGRPGTQLSDCFFNRLKASLEYRLTRCVRPLPQYLRDDAPMTNVSATAPKRLTSMRFAKASDLDALRRFSQRLAPVSPFAKWALTPMSLPGASPDDDFPIRLRKLIAEVDGEIRAIQNFFEHQIYIDDRPHSFVWPTGPLSEALIDPMYGGLWLALLRYGMTLQPLHLVLGSYRVDQPPLGRAFDGLRWSRASVDSFVHPINFGAICRKPSAIRSGRLMKIATALAGYSGVADAASLTMRLRRRLGWRDSTTIEEVDEFGSWSDAVWQNARKQYKALTRRDMATLNRLYRPGDRRVRRLRVRRGGQDIGWALLVIRSFSNDPILGALRAGIVVDALADPADVIDVMRAALSVSVDARADVCLGWWSHDTWKHAARAVGFFRARPGDMRLYVSPAAKPLLLTDRVPIEAIHLTRGDCDGPRRFIALDSEADRCAL
jgi:hypothetical protein